MEDDFQRSKHKSFLSHSGAQKPFVEQLCADLEGMNHSSFFDQSSDSLPVGADFAPRIFEAAKHCLVAVIVLSKEYMTSKWPMLELSAFVQAQKEGNPNLKLLPLFYKLSPEDLDDMNFWMEDWRKVAEKDSRIDIKLWMKAVRKLRKVKGLPFEMFGKSELKYRLGVVQEICTLLPPALLFDTSDVQGMERLCKIMVSMFENVDFDINKQGTQYLGLYGMGGLGKTTMCKALCNHYQSEFSGRVCHVELGSDKPVALQKRALKKLTGLREEVLRNITDRSEGQQCLKDRLGRQSVFLALDNVGASDGSREEAEAYIKEVRLRSGSKVLITSRSREILEPILGDAKYCKPIPDLEMEEASKLFLSKAVPTRAVSSLTREEREVLRRCVDKCKFHVGSTLESNQAIRQYHALAIRAWGAYFSTKDITSWAAWLDDIKIPSDVFDIFVLGYKKLCPTSQLIFLDVALSYALADVHFSRPSYCDAVSWLAMAHGEGRLDIEDKLEGLRRNSFLNEWVNKTSEITMHDLYEEFAHWLVENDEGAKAVFLFRSPINFSFGDFRWTLTSSCWAHLRRVSLSSVSFPPYGMKKVQEWCNVVILDLVCCHELRVLDLRGFNCLRSLCIEMCCELECVVTVCNREGDGSRCSGCMPQLQWVKLGRMDVLKKIPRCWNLSSADIWSCYDLEDPLDIQCWSRLENLRSQWMYISARDLDFENHRLLTRVEIEGFSFPGVTGMNVKGLSSLTNLRYLCLVGRLSTEPIGRIPMSVEDLRLDRCNLDTVLSFSTLMHLKNLIIVRCKEVVSLDVRGLTGLTTLFLGDLSHLRVVEVLDQLSNIQQLWIQHCPSLALDVLDVGQLKHLTGLGLVGANVHELKGVDKLFRLYELDLQNCKRLSKLPQLTDLPVLKWFCMEGCWSLGSPLFPAGIQAYHSHKESQDCLHQACLNNYVRLFPTFRIPSGGENDCIECQPRPRNQKSWELFGRSMGLLDKIERSICLQHENLYDIVGGDRTP